MAARCSFHVDYFDESAKGICLLQLFLPHLVTNNNAGKNGSSDESNFKARLFAHFVAQSVSLIKL